MILAGDIGGTNTRLGVFSAGSGPFKPLAKKNYPSHKYGGLEEIVREFIAEHDLSVSKACFGVAGPVKENTAIITNLPWVIDGKNISKKTGIKEVILLNDLEAMANAIPILDRDSVEPISKGIPRKNEVKALIAPGTGLGEVFLTWDGSRYRAHRSEGGHTEFGPRNDLEAELLTHLRKKYDHVSYERVCSGMGLPNLYYFFRDTGRFKEPKELAKKLAEAEDKTPIIFNAALEDPERNQICVAVVELFCSILAAQAGNLALTVSCHGGIYIGGGIPPRIVAYIRRPEFISTFKDKGRLSAMIADIPIYLVTHPDMALTGAASHALSL